MKYPGVSCLLLGIAVTLPSVVLNSQSRTAASNPVPFIGQPLAPSRATPSTHGLTITVRGVGFVSGSLVQWNGQALPTTFVSGESVAAAVPASFPPQTVGTTSAPKTVKFANIGIVPVNISKIQVVGYYAGTNDCPATLPVGGSCTVTVAFTPGFVGLTGGEVIANDDALGSQQWSGLEGIGK